MDGSEVDAPATISNEDKQNPQRKAVTGSTVTSVPPSRMDSSEINGLRARLMRLWKPPVGVKDPNELIVNVNIKLRRDGRLAAPPLARVNGSTAAAAASRDSAVRAVVTGQPFDMLKPEHYEGWKEIELTFDPKDMFGSN
jgi:colicin import membrane protein